MENDSFVGRAIGDVRQVTLRCSHICRAPHAGRERVADVALSRAINHQKSNDSVEAYAGRRQITAPQPAWHFSSRGTSFPGTAIQFPGLNPDERTWGVITKEFKTIKHEFLKGCGSVIRTERGTIAQETMDALVQGFHHRSEMVWLLRLPAGASQAYPSRIAQAWWWNLGSFDSFPRRFTVEEGELINRNGPEIGA